MKPFLARYLPVSERRTALWLALGGSAIAALVTLFGSAVMSQLPVNAVDNPMPLGVAQVVQALAQFALVTLLIAALIRFARAPRVLALYLLLGGVVDAAVAVLNVPGDLIGAATQSELGLVGQGVSPVQTVFAAMLVSLGVGLGAVAGAWIVSTVSLARIRDAGFSGDAPDGEGLRSHAPSGGWEFIGWSGGPATGDALIAIAFVAVSIIPSLVTTAANLMLAIAPASLLSSENSLVQPIAWAVLTAIAWFLSAGLVTLRSDVVSSWTVALGGLLGTLIYIFEYALQTRDGLVLVYSAAASLVPSVVLVAAALLGTARALKREPATLTKSGRGSSGR